MKLKVGVTTYYVIIDLHLVQIVFFTPEVLQHQRIIQNLNVM